MKTPLLALALLIFAGTASAAPAPAKPTGPDYTPLHLYNGQWKVTPVDPTGESRSVVLGYSCNQAGIFYVCQQTVAGVVGGMMVFVPAGAPGAWKTQFVAPNGAGGAQPGDLTIEDEIWTFSTREDDDTGAVFTRVTNRFSGPDKIHFEKAQSTDGINWTVQLSGHEVRMH